MLILSIMEKGNERILKISISKSGGTAWKGSKSFSIRIPNNFIKELGITENDRNVKMKLNGSKIIIEKYKDV